MGTLGQLWDMTSQISVQILGQSSLKSTLSLINGNCVYTQRNFEKIRDYYGFEKTWKTIKGSLYILGKEEG